MAPEEFQKISPQVLEWIQKTISDSSHLSRSVNSFHFSRLSHWFNRNLLQNAFVVLVDHCPRPQLSALGLKQLAEFEAKSLNGITYLNTYFLQKCLAENESLHFHELVHVIQWGQLGSEQFLFRYAEGLENSGYDKSPLEEMAYRYQARFEKGEESQNMEEVVFQELLKLGMTPSPLAR